MNLFEVSFLGVQHVAWLVRITGHWGLCVFSKKDLASLLFGEPFG